MFDICHDDHKNEINAGNNLHAFLEYVSNMVE